MSADEIRLTDLRERPHLADRLWDLTHLWPRFMLEDPLATFYYRDCAEAHPELVLAATAGPDETLVGRGFAVPFALDLPDRGALPVDGWDGVVRWSWLDRADRRQPDTVSALEITLAPGVRGSGLAARMVEAMRVATARRGADRLVAPVRPSRKADEPWTPMSEYAARRGVDGLPADPWLRVHARLGAEVVAVAPRSMTISGSLDEWRSWTGLPFDRSGPVAVPGALVPVHVDVDQDHAVYVEPNVWMAHQVR